MRKRLLVGALAAAAFAAGCGGGSAPKPADAGPLKIGLLLDELREERWQRDRDLFVSRACEGAGRMRSTAAIATAESRNVMWIVVW